MRLIYRRKAYDSEVSDVGSPRSTPRAGTAPKLRLLRRFQYCGHAYWRAGYPSWQLHNALCLTSTNVGDGQRLVAESGTMGVDEWRD